MDPNRTALVLIEFQNDFTSDGGALHGAVAESMHSTGMLANAVRTTGAARSAGAAVVHCPISFAGGYREITASPYGILKGVVDSNAFVQGDWGAQIDYPMFSKPMTGDQFTATLTGSSSTADASRGY